MKKHFFIILVSIIGAQFNLAQDKIYLKDDETPIITKVLDISPTEIKYKKFDFQDGPTYTELKSNILRIEFQNGDIESYEEKSTKQKSESLIPDSKIYLEYSEVDDKNNVEKDDVLSISRKELLDLTNLKLVNSLEDADFKVTVQVTKYMITKRKAKFSITHLLSNKKIFESEWFRGAPSEFNGFSGTRQAIGRIIKKSLLNSFPEISK